MVTWVAVSAIRVWFVVVVVVVVVGVVFWGSVGFSHRNQFKGGRKSHYIRSVFNFIAKCLDYFDCL